MNVKTGIVTPFHEHLDENVIDQPFLFQHLQYMCPKEFRTAPNIHFGHDIKIATIKKQAFRHEGVEVGMPSGIVAKCLNYNNDTGNSVLFAQDDFQKFRYTLRCTLVQFPKQFSVIEEELTNNFCYAENLLSMWNRKYYRFFEMMGKLNQEPLTRKA